MTNYRLDFIDHSGAIIETTKSHQFSDKDAIKYAKRKFAECMINDCAGIELYNDDYDLINTIN